MKKILILVHDYWHHEDSIAPLLPLISEVGYEITFTKDPQEFYPGEYDLVISFKDPVENDQVPTPVWCDEKWTALFLERIKAGMGFMAVHAGLTDLPEEHPMFREAVRGMFLSHPAPCRVKFIPHKEHPVLEGLGEFEFPVPDEHYVIKLYEEYPTEVIAHTESANGSQPAVWVHGLGKGRICCITPSHTSEGLTCPPFVQLMKNAVKYCIK